jgi:nucleoside-diphosphate-sugar epimerase
MMVSMTNQDHGTDDQDPNDHGADSVSSSLHNLRSTEAVSRDSSKPAKAHKVLIIGADQIVGKALMNMDLPANEVAFCAPAAIERAEVLRFDKLASFSPRYSPKWVLFVAPLWDLSFEVLSHLYDLGCERLIALSSVERITLIDSVDEAEQRRAEKWRAGEERLMAFCAENRMSFTILRATSIYNDEGEGDYQSLFESLMLNKIIPLAYGGKGLRQPVHADDVANALLGVLGHLGTKNATYSIGGGEVLSLKSLMARFMRHMNVKTILLPLPGFLINGMVGAMRLIGLKVFEGVNGQLIKRMGENMTFDHRRARDDFGYNPRAFLSNPKE